MKKITWILFGLVSTLSLNALSFYNIRNYGACADTTQLSTNAIQKAIDDCFVHGAIDILTNFIVFCTLFSSAVEASTTNCPFNPLHHLVFAQDFEQMVEAGAGGFAGHGQAARMHQHTGFHAHGLGGFL